MSKPDEPDEPDQSGEHGKDSVAVVVNGAATVVTYHGNPTLREIVTGALDQTQNSGQPVENWELRAPDGTPLSDLDEKIKKLDLVVGAQLFLNLRAGIGG
jgi:hypothetical protein